MKIYKEFCNFIFIDIAKNPDLYKSDTKGLPLLLILGYSNGVQIWYITVS